MRSEVSTQEVETYRRDGFLVIEELLDPRELELWRDVVDDAVMERGRVILPALGEVKLLPEELLPDSPEAAELSEEKRQQLRRGYQVFKQRVNLWQTDERVRSIILDPRLGKLVADLAGVDGVRIWHDQALLKPPYGNPTPFHLDSPYWSFTSVDALSIWVALDDATTENGCLYYVPGSHRAQKFDNVDLLSEIGALFDLYPEWAGSAPVACSVPAGGALVHNGLTFHGAGANMTPGWRRAMTCAYMPDGGRFNGIQNILSDDQVAGLSIGDLLDDEAQNPLVYSRSTPLASVP